MQQQSLLSDRSVLLVSGPDASNFLQGLITNDLEQLKGKGAIYAALLTPQGKILFDFIVVSVGGDTFYIDCAMVQRDDLVNRLTLYRLRAKVEIAVTPLAVAASWGEEEPPSISGQASIFVDPRHKALGKRTIAPANILRKHFQCNDAAYQACRLKLGIPDSADLPTNTIFPLDAGFEELNGVNFTKGCYVGQEVTSRMKHRTNARKRFIIVHTDRQYPPGTPLKANGQTIGNLGPVTGNTGLALLRLDRVLNAVQEGASITIDGNKIHLQKPVWLDTSIKIS